MANGPMKEPEFAPQDTSVQVTSVPRPGDNQPDDRHVTKTVSRDLPFLMDGDWLQVTNDDKVAIEFSWNRVANPRNRWVIQPGQTEFVIFEAVVNKLGDPRSEYGNRPRFDSGARPQNGAKGGQPYIPERYEELNRMFAMYGVREERLTDFVKILPDGKEERIPGLQSLVPKVTVRTMAGQLIRFPAQAPEATPYPVPNPTKQVGADVNRMFSQLEAEKDALAEKVRQLEQRMDAQYAGEQGIEPQG